jgi:hypothetical protein
MTGSGMFEYLIPAVMRSLRVLIHYLDEVERRVEDGILAEETVIGARLAGDMLPFTEQIRLVSENAKNGPARLCGVTAPQYSESDQSIRDLKQRLMRTLDYVATYAPQYFGEAEERNIPQTFRQVGYAMRGGDYLREVLLPNFYFHVTVVHTTLRQLGVAIGKADFLGVAPRFTDQAKDDSTIRFLSRAECRAWRQDRSFPDGFIGRPLAGQFQVVEQHTVAQNPGVGVGGGLIELVAWTIGGDHDGDPTQDLRRAHCDVRSLAEVPGTYFDSGEGVAARNLWQLIARKNWHGYFYAEDGRTIIEIDPTRSLVVFRRYED